MPQPRNHLRQSSSQSSTASLGTVTLVIFVATLLAYALLLTKNYYWDGIFFAQVLEDTPRINATLIHPSHLLDLVFEYVLFRAVRLLGFHSRALTVLQVSNCVLAAGAIALFFRICFDWFKSLYVSLTATTLFAFSATWWRFATDADTYVFAVLFLLIALHFLKPEKKSQPLVVAFTHAFAMLLHQLSVLFFPVAVAGLLLQANRHKASHPWRNVVTYAVTATLLTAGVYYLVFHAVANTWSFSRFVSWITYFSPENGFSFNAASNLGYTLRSQVRVFLGGRIAFVREFPGPVMIMLAALTGIAAVAFLFALLRHGRELRNAFVSALELLKQFKPLTVLCAVWIVPYIVFLFFFIPQNVFYRLFYLPAIILLIGAVLATIEASPNHIRRYRAALFAATVIFANLTFSQYPYTQVRANPPLQFAQSLNKVWSTGTVIYYASPNTDASLVRYFNPGTVWIQVRPAEFTRQLAELPVTTRGAWLETTLVDQLETTTEGRAWLARHTVRRGDSELVNSKFRIRFYQLKSD